ncbi:MAG: transposase [Nitrospirota bacterium]|nr:transposase [Nitrospirota bacterium]MDH5699738.1 transposase [Nitrospirota bacterium]
MEVLQTAFWVVQATRPFEVEAMVMLPDHLCLRTLPPGDADFGTRWRLVKTRFPEHRDPAWRVAPNHARSAKRGQAVWQHRYWEHLLRDETDFVRHVEYIHVNPVKHGLASSPMQWPYSSFRRYVEGGSIPLIEDLAR